MDLSKVMGVKEDTNFGIRGRVGHYKIVDNKLYRSFCCDEHWEEESPSVVLGVILYEVPDGIIHIPPEHTNELREQLKAFVIVNFTWLAMDENGDVFAYRGKPEKRKTTWENFGKYFYVNSDDLPEICRLVSWSDAEPLYILKMLEENE